MTVFGDVYVSVYGNSDVLKFTFTFKCVLLENQKSNYFYHILYIAALYLLFIPVSFIKFNPLSLSWYFLQNSRKVLFQAATSQSGKQLHVPRLLVSGCLLPQPSKTLVTLSNDAILTSMRRKSAVSASILLRLVPRAKEPMFVSPEPPENFITCYQTT